MDGQKKDTENTLEHNRSCAQSRVTSIKSAEVLKVRMRALFFSTIDLLLILNQVSAHIVLSRNKKRKITNKTNKCWSETHVQV